MECLITGQCGAAGYMTLTDLFSTSAIDTRCNVLRWEQSVAVVDRVRIMSWLYLISARSELVFRLSAYAVFHAGIEVSKRYTERMTRMRKFVIRMKIESRQGMGRIDVKNSKRNVSFHVQ